MITLYFTIAGIGFSLLFSLFSYDVEKQFFVIGQYLVPFFIMLGLYVTHKVRGRK